MGFQAAEGCLVHSRYLPGPLIAPTFAAGGPRTSSRRSLSSVELVWQNGLVVATGPESAGQPWRFAGPQTPQRWAEAIAGPGALIAERPASGSGLTPLDRGALQAHCSSSSWDSLATGSGELPIPPAPRRTAVNWLPWLGWLRLSPAPAAERGGFRAARAL